MRLTRALRSPALALGLLTMVTLHATGCAPPAARIAQGQPFTTGAPTFDDFFNAVRDLRAEAQRAEADEQASHASLIAALGLEPKTSALMAVNEAGQRAHKIRDAGVLLHLELLPVTKVLTKRESASGNLNLEGKDFLKAVEESTRSSLALSRRVGSIGARAAELEKIRVTLRAQAPSAFRAQLEARRDDIIRELDAAEGVLSETAALGDRYSGLAAKFVLDLAHVLETGADAYPEAQEAVEALKAASQSAVAPASSSPPAAAEPVPAAKKPPAPAGRPPAVRRPRAAPRPSPPPPSKPAEAKPAETKPKGSDDFEP